MKYFIFFVYCIMLIGLPIVAINSAYKELIFICWVIIALLSVVTFKLLEHK